MYNHTVLSDIKRALSGRGFIMGMVGMILFIGLSSIEGIIVMTQIEEPLPNGYHGQVIMDALSSDWVTLILPIICSLPFTTAFIDDIKSGFVKQYLHRSGLKGYIKGKLFACGFSGGLVIFCGIVLAYGISALVFTPMELALGTEETAQMYFPQVLTKATLFFCFGAFWSLMGFTLGAMTMNRYMAYASPFIVYYMLIILCERYCEKLYVLYPKEWMFISQAWVLDDWGVILLILEMIAILSLSFVIIAKRRLSNV